MKNLTPKELELRSKIDRAFRGSKLFMRFSIVELRKILEGHLIGEEEPAHQELLDGQVADALIEFLKSKIKDDPFDGPLVTFTHHKDRREVWVSVSYLGVLSPSFLALFLDKCLDTSI